MDYLLVTGSVSQDGTAGQLDPPYRISADAAGDTADPNGSYCVRQSGSSGTLADFCFTPSFTTVDDEPLTTGYFAWRIPYAAGATTLALVQKNGGGEQTLSSATSAGPPSIGIQTPQPGDTLSGMTTIAWTASDPGGAPLTYLVQVSNDGGNTWYPLSYNLTDAQFAIDVGTLLGGSQTYLRVIVMNGVDSTIAAVGPLNVPQNPILQVSPTSLDFGNVGIGASATLTITLSNNGTGLLPINSIASDNPAFVTPTGTMYISPGIPRNLSIQFAPTVTGAQTANITINGSVVITAKGVGSGATAPSLSITPAVLDFGAVAPGTSKSLTFTVRNTGPSAVSVTGINPIALLQTFSISPTSYSLQPGSQALVGVRFTPTDSSPQTEKFNLVSTDAASNSVIVTLTGNSGGTGTCTFTLSAASASVAAAGGAGTVSVTATGPCAAWTAVSNVSWITVTSGANGTSPVGYTVAANTGGARSGTLTIAGLTYTVNQAAGAAPTPSPSALISDSFQRANADQCSLGKGGSGSHYYLPIFPGASGPIGAKIVSSALQNNGLDFGGVQFTASASPCASGRGENVGQDLNMRLDILVPSDAAGHQTDGGPYFRSRAAAAGDGIIGGSSAGYWVQLVSSGEVRVFGLNPFSTIASTGVPASFNNAVSHRLEIAAKGAALQVALDGGLLTFTQNGAATTTVSLPAQAGSNDGTAGIAFGAEANRGQAGGQRVTNLVVSPWSALGGPPPPVPSACTGTFSNVIGNWQWVAGAAGEQRTVLADGNYISTTGPPGVWRQYSNHKFQLTTTGFTETTPIINLSADGLTLTDSAGNLVANRICLTGGPPAMTLSPTSLDFGTVTAGQSKDLNMTITNTGSNDLTIGSTTAAFVPAGFRPVSPAAPFTVAAGKSIDLTVRFTPPGPGTFTTHLDVISNDPAHDLVSVPLAGVGR